MTDQQGDRPQPVSSSGSRRQMVSEVILLAVLCWLFFFFGLSSFGLLGADEPRYAQVAREMLDRHDWVTPVLYGKPWLEKPIAYYWAAMTSYTVFGVSGWAARVPGAAMASLMAVFIYLWLRRFRPGSELDALSIVVSTAFVIGFGRGASMDIQLAVPFTIGMLAWWSWYETGHRGWLALFYAAMGVGTLAKGPVAPFLAAMVIVVFASVQRDFRTILRCLWWPGLLLWAAIALPWYFAVQHATPQFFREFILQHNLDRFATNRYFHKQPFWYYVPVLLAGLMPWSVLVATSAAHEFRALHKTLAGPAQKRLGIFLLTWILLPVLFFSFSHSKLPGYILPCIPPCGILAALHILRKKEAEERPGAVLATLHALLPAGLLAAVAVAPSVLLKQQPSSQVVAIAATAGAIVLLASGLVIYRGGYRAIRTATLVPMALALVFLIRFAGPLVDVTQSMRALAGSIQASALPDAPVITFDTPRQVEYGLAYYLNRPLGGPQLQEFSAEHANAFPRCGTYVLVARRGSIDAVRVIAGDAWSIQPLDAPSRPGIPWATYSLLQPCSSKQEE